MSEDRSRRSQSRGSLGGQRDPRPLIDSRYDTRHDYRLDPLDSRHRDIDHSHDRQPAAVPLLHDADRDSGYFRGGGERGYDRVPRIDHVDISRPPPPLPFRGPWPPEPDRLPARGSSDRLDEYHRDMERHDRSGTHLLRPPNWDRMDRSSRDEWENKYTYEQVFIVSALLTAMHAQYSCPLFKHKKLKLCERN